MRPNLSRHSYIFLIPILVISFVAVAFYYRFSAEDAYIVSRYAENFVDTGALVFNAGERVNALTSPLHALMEALLYRLTGATLEIYKLVSVSLMICSVMLMIVLFKDNRHSQLVIMSIILLSPTIILWTFGGMETPMLLFLITLMSVVVYREREYRLIDVSTISVLAGLAFVTRFDSMLFTAPLVLFVLVKYRNVKKSIIAGFLGSLVPILFLIVSLRYYGDALPTSFYVKMPDFSKRLMLNNLLYVGQYLFFVGLIPSAVFLFLTTDSKRKLTRLVLSHVRKLWGLYLGILIVLVYGLTIATTHMMFSFRYFVPYIPASVILIADLFRIRDSKLQNVARIPRYDLYFGLFLILMIGFQTFQLLYTYKYSVNGILLSEGEYGKEGVEGYARDFMPTLANAASDIESHWQSLDKSKERVPRIVTFAAGILPYTYRRTYIYEPLVSYRHNCIIFFTWWIAAGRPLRSKPGRELTPVDPRISADYIHILTPYHGSIEYHLGEPVEDYQLISSYDIEFDGSEQSFMVFYNPDPDINPLPESVNGSCE